MSGPKIWDGKQKSFVDVYHKPLKFYPSLDDTLDYLQTFSQVKIFLPEYIQVFSAVSKTQLF